MGILWRVSSKSCCLTVIILGCLIGSSFTSPSPEPSVEPTTEAGVKDEKKSEEKTSGDLDLETQDQVAILKQINRVNEDGSYTFGYEAADGSFKIETRDVAGNVRGMFGFINEDGELKRVSYSASNGTGFQSSGVVNIPPLPGTPMSPDETFPKSFERGYTGRFQQNSQQEDTASRIDLLRPIGVNYISTTTAKTTTLEPTYIISTTTPDDNSSLRPVVIQHIPKVRPTPATSTTVSTDSQEVSKPTTIKIITQKKVFDPGYITFQPNLVTTETTPTSDTFRKPEVVQVIKSRLTPYKKLIITKRPVDTTTPTLIRTTEASGLERTKEKELQYHNEIIGSGLRRQLGRQNAYLTNSDQTGLLTSGTEDSPDVYGGGPTARPYTAAAYRTLFTQVPQHQRILQNSYIQNQNQYLAAALPNGNVPGAPAPGQVPGGYPLEGVPPNLAAQPNVQAGAQPSPVPGYIGVPPQPALGIKTPQPPVPSGPPTPGAATPYPYYNQPNNPNLFLPPALMDQIIRMLLIAQQTQNANPLIRALLAGYGNPNPTTYDPRYAQYPNPPVYDPRYAQFPNPNYSMVPNPYSPALPYPPPQYDPRYQDPRYQDPRFADPRYQDPRFGDPRYTDPRSYPYPAPYTNIPYPVDPRYTQRNFVPVQPPIPPPAENPNIQYQNRAALEAAYQEPKEDPLLLRMLLSARYPQPLPQPLPNPAAQYPNYGQRLPDSTTAATTTKLKSGSIRNVKILTNEESETSTSTKRY